MTEPKSTYTAQPAVIIHDAMADVFSGATHRPEPPAPGEDVFSWPMNTHAWQRAVIYIAGDRRVDLSTTLLAGPGETVNDGAVLLARDQFDEYSATVLVMGNKTERWLIALNEDGTRACTISVAALAAARNAMAAAILADWRDTDADDLPPELTAAQLAEIARAWPWSTRDALGHWLGVACTRADITDRTQRRALQRELQALCGEN